MAGGPTRDTSLHRRVAELEREVSRLRNELQRQTSRIFEHAYPRDIRLAKTVADDEDNYPESPCNTYRIELLDSYFPKTVGSQTATHQQRGEKLFAHDTEEDRYFTEGEIVKVFRSRGLGDAEQGEWWILEGANVVLAEAELAEDMCGEENETVSVTNGRTIPDCTSLDLDNETIYNTCRHQAPSGSKVRLVKTCDCGGSGSGSGSGDCSVVGWDVYDVVRRPVCVPGGAEAIESQAYCLVYTPLIIAAEWCPSSEPTEKCLIDYYILDCVDTGECDLSVDFVATPCCSGSGSGS